MAKRSTIAESVRFTGRWGKQRLLAAIKEQNLVSGNNEIAREVIKCGDLLHFQKDDTLMVQGKPENDIYLIMTGEVSIRINGRDVAIRTAGSHIGEMALVDQVATRSATAVALQPTAAIRIPEHRFTKMAAKYPELWRRIAVEIAKRLRERSRFLKQPHNEPVLFVGSSSEGQQIASQIHRRFQNKSVVVRLWTDGVFQASRTSIENLVNATQESDFAALVLTADDTTISRGKKKPSPRDNVVFELGLFMGALGRERVFILKPKGLDVRIPSDLLGIVWVDYLRAGPKKQRLRLTCETLLQSIRQVGPK
jgi:CRP/FNR family transcriptional regulator, cyclic AMP receptor protein